MNDALPSMTPREGVVASGGAAVVSSVLIPVLAVIGGLAYRDLPSDLREFVPILFTLLIAACGFIAVAAVIILLAELFAWRDEISLIENHACRAAAAQPQRHQSTSMPLSAPSAPTAEDVSFELLRSALAKREEALWEAERIARVLHLIDQEISK